jgi:hypothetical protein
MGPGAVFDGDGVRTHEFLRRERTCGDGRRASSRYVSG